MKILLFSINLGRSEAVVKLLQIFLTFLIVADGFSKG